MPSTMPWGRSRPSDPDRNISLHHVGSMALAPHIHRHRVRFRECDPMGITYEQFVVLTHLYHKPDLSQTELADAAFMDKTSLAREQLFNTVCKRFPLCLFQIEGAEAK